MKFKYLSKNQSIVEFKPCVRTIYFNDNKYTISMPYQIFISFFAVEGNTAQFAYSSLFFTKKPLKNKYDLLYLPPIFNVSAEGNICLGSIPPRKRKGQHIQLTKWAINLFWNSAFNRENGGAYVVNGISIENWRQQTKCNPNYWKQLPCMEFKTLNEICYFHEKSVINELC